MSQSQAPKSGQKDQRLFDLFAEQRSLSSILPLVIGRRLASVCCSRMWA